jgi:hypothetical protein
MCVCDVKLRRKGYHAYVAQASNKLAEVSDGWIDKVGVAVAPGRYAAVCFALPFSRPSDATVRAAVFVALALAVAVLIDHPSSRFRHAAGWVGEAMNGILLLPSDDRVKAHNLTIPMIINSVRYARRAARPHGGRPHE